MLFKITGILLIIGTTSAGGITAADRIRSRYEQLRYLKNLFCILKSEIRYAGSYLGEAFRKIGRTKKSPYREWLLGMCQKMEAQEKETLAEIWEEQTNIHLRALGFAEEEFEKLVNFGGQLGAADVQTQIRVLELYEEELELSMKEMREEMQAKIRLCHCLGVMSGVFITILLL